MIEICRITDCSTQEYQFTEELLTASFPEEEYRELDMLRKYVEKEKDFYYHIILHDEEPIGLVSFLATKQLLLRGTSCCSHQ